MCAAPKAKRTESGLLIGQHSSAASVTWRPDEPNADQFTISAIEYTDDPSTSMTLAAVAHGLPGASTSRPDVVAKLVIDTLVECFEQVPLLDVVLLLDTAFHRASARIVELHKTASVVCSGAVITTGKLYVASCGNCRIVLVRDGHAVQVAVAHAMADMLVEKGHVTWEDLKNRPGDPPPAMAALGQYAQEPLADQRLILDDGTANRQVLGIQPLPLLPNDRIVLLSYERFGNWHLPDILNDIEAYFSDLDLSPQETVDRFVNYICKRGNLWDLTVLLLQIPS